VTWVDGPGWNPERSRLLCELLVEGYASDSAMRGLVKSLGLGLGIMPEDAKLGVRWYTLATDLHRMGLLRRAAEELIRQSPVLADRVNRLLEDDPPDPGNPPDRYQAHLLSGRRPLIDRVDLRYALRLFLTEQRPVLLVRGDPRTGKSYSFQLLLHVTDGWDGVDVVHADFSAATEGDDARALMTKLRSRLGLPRLQPADDPTTPVRSAGGLVDDLVGDYRQLAPLRRIIVIDGLNRPDLQNDVHQVAAALIREVINRGLPQAQIVLTGYSGDIDPALSELIIAERLLTLTETEVREFFEGLMLDRQLKAEEINELVTEAAVGQGDIGDIALRVQASVRKLLQPASGGGR
jgi:hypothetical protein